MTDDLKRALERELNEVRAPAGDPGAAVAGGKRRRRNRLFATTGAGVFLAIIVGVGALALGEEGDRPLPETTPAPSETTPRCDGPEIELSKTAGRPGERIRITGTCLGEAEASLMDFSEAAALSLQRFSAVTGRRCLVQAPTRHDVEVAHDGSLRGFFVVPAGGRCIRGSHVSLLKAIPAGTYRLTTVCCSAIRFRVLPERTRESAEPIALSGLPPEGFAIATDRGVEFVDPDGTLISTVPGLEMAPNTDASGVFFRDRSNYYELDADTGTLEPITKVVYDEHLSSHGMPVSFDPPSGSRVEGQGIAGSWLHAFDRGDGVHLAQWSGECEVPTAYWIEPGAEPQIVTGEGSLREAPPKSTALGWVDAGDAFVYIGEGACGGPGDPPGIYAFSAPGEGRLVYATPPNAFAVDMWP